MEKIRRFFYNNKKEIFKVVGIIVIIIVAIQILNQLAKKKIAEENSAKKTIDYGRDISAVSNEKKNSNVYKEEKGILETFVKYCNDKDYDSAYSMLSEECREALYPTEKEFKEKYCDINFDIPKTCGFQVWSGNTYKVEIRDDIMSSGKYIKERYNEDFYTIQNNKINIGKLIKRTKFVNTESEGDFKVRIDTMDVFKDYTVINISAINKSDKQALVDPLISDRYIYITDNNGVKYFFSVSEVAKEDVIIKPGETKQIPLKFYITSREDLTLETLSIERMIENYNNYETGLGYAYTETKLEL